MIGRIWAVADSMIGRIWAVADIRTQFAPENMYKS